MKPWPLKPTLLAVAIAATALAFTACKRTPSTDEAPPATSTAPANETADAFIARAVSGDIGLPSKRRACSIQPLSWVSQRSLAFAATSSLSLLM